MLLRILPLLAFPGALLAQGLQPVLLTELAPPLHETSGLLIVEGQVWTHGDSGNPNSLYHIDPATGAILREVVLANASNTDWEEVTTDGTWVYVGDFGNNLGSRTDLRIYRFPLAELMDDGVTAVTCDTIRFVYADQVDFTPANQATNWDCEAFIAKDDSLFLFTKNWADLRSHLYVLPAEPGDHLALRRDTLMAQGLITGAAYDPGQGVIALIGYTGVMMPFVWRLSGLTGNDLFGGDSQRFELPLPFTQAEGIAWAGTDSVLISNEANFLGPARLWSLRMDRDIGVASVERPARFNLHPNPASDTVHLSGLHAPTEVRVLDEQGTVVRTALLGTGGLLDIEDLPTGVYVVEAVHEGAVERTRLMVVR